MAALARLILQILASFIEIEIIFSIVGILTTLRNCWLQIDNLDKLIFVHENWPSNPHVGCLKPFDLAVICEVKSNLTNELDVKFVDEVECEEYANGHL